MAFAAQGFGIRGAQTHKSFGCSKAFVGNMTFKSLCPKPHTLKPQPSLKFALGSFLLQDPCLKTANLEIPKRVFVWVPMRYKLHIRVHNKNLQNIGYVSLRLHKRTLFECRCLDFDQLPPCIGSKVRLLPPPTSTCNTDG